MHVDAIELLRCPVDHAASSLVASATQQHDRRIIEGALGCPVCGAEYPIRGGIADFLGVPAADAANAQQPNEDAAVRLAAQLDLTEPGRVVLLIGAYGLLAPALDVMFDTRCIVAGVGASAEHHVAAHASVLRLGAVLPLASASMHGVAIDSAHLAQLGLDQILALVRVNGRLVAPATQPLPGGMSELASDEREWVGVRSADVVGLRRSVRLQQPLRDT